MTDTAPSAAKVKAIELANMHAAEPAKVVERANAYHAFLTGAAAAPASKPATTGGAATGTKPPTDANKGAAQTGGKPTGDANKTAATGTKGATGNKPAATGNKPADANKGAAGNKPAANASAAAVASDTKAEGGKFTYGEMVAKLRDLQQADASGRAKAFEILKAQGGDAKTVREVKPAAYDAVVAAAEKAIKALKAKAAAPAGDDDDPLGDPPEQTAGGLDAEDDPTSQPARDDMGL